MTNRTDAIKLAIEALEDAQRSFAPAIHSGISAALAALQEQAREGEAVAWLHGCNVLCADIDLWIDRCPHCGKPRPAAPAPQPAREGESVKFLANGKRFKLSSAGGPVAVFLGFPPELAGRWVALVAAEDDCHLKLAAPQPAQPEQGHST